MCNKISQGLPNAEQALKGSLSTINKTITNFAVKLFKDGARRKFAQFLREETANVQ
jgi:hypothetical protein